MNDKSGELSRRGFLAFGALLASTGAKAESGTGPARFRVDFKDGWLFGGKLEAAATGARFDDKGFSEVTLPHSVAKLSWQDWNPAAWQDVWIYRRHFSVPAEFKNRRVFLQFDGVMTGATPVINGNALPEHLGGYLPFRYEISEWLVGGDNVLAVAVDSRWKNVPPEGSPKGAISVDYLEPGGILRPVSLCAVPQVFISDVFAKPVNVLDAARRAVEISCSIDAAAMPGKSIQIRAELKDGARVLATAQRTLKLDAPGQTEASMSLAKLGNVQLWDVDSPKLYEVVTTLFIDGKPVHNHSVRIGFREARFGVDGFFLNGRRLQLFGLNRHEVYPYVGAGMPRRVLRRDAEILRREFNCNIVRCSHYPQSEEFLDACDELGLMVWEEMPGWQYLGDAAWRELAVRDVREMVRRDRNRPSVVIWGVRINESRNDPALYARTREVARSLDDSRPTSGSMTPESTKNWREEWHQDVFAFDDYHSAPDGSVGIREPLPGVPYMLAEAVGQFNYTKRKVFDAKYRRAGDVTLQQAQALRHAQAHDRTMSFPRCAGVIAWCAFDYGSLINPFRGVKCPGVADVFRIPKLGASFYQAQVNPKLRPVIAPNFYWDFGTETPHGPGANAAIFSNCERLEIFIGGKRRVVAQPDRAGFPHVHYPPFFCDLSAEGLTSPELRIDGYLGEKLVLSRSFSSDRSRDQFQLTADDGELMGDGADATRLAFQVVDRFGAIRPFDSGEVTLELHGPGTIVGDNPFPLADNGAGAVWIRTLPKSSGNVAVTAAHSLLGKKSVQIKVRPAGRV